MFSLGRESKFAFPEWPSMDGIMPTCSGVVIFFTQSKDSKAKSLLETPSHTHTHRNNILPTTLVFLSPVKITHKINLCTVLSNATFIIVCLILLYAEF